MSARAYYNEIDPFAADWLRELMRRGLIADGEIDTHSIVDVRAEDLAGFTRCHFFAGIGGWDYALQLAGWPSDRPVWTGSCPCQPFSLAGARQGFDDSRHLWPQFARLIKDASPATVFGEQVASATDWLGLVRGDLDAMGYAVGAMPIEAASAGADHLRDRFWFVADRTEQSQGRRRIYRSTEGAEEAFGRQAPEELIGSGSHVVPLANTARERCREARSDCERHAQRAARCGDTFNLAHALSERGCGRHSERPDAGNAHASGETIEWVTGADGKRRPVKSGLRLLAHGVPNRVGSLRGFGNAIDPRPASEFILSFLETERQ